MNKMQMAHEYALKMLENLNPMQMEKPTRDGIVHQCFELADAMQAEADKRDKAEAEQKSKEVREILKDANAFIEREWQPDWSQAPDEAKYWAMDKDGSANFFRRNPEITNGNGWDFGGVMQSNNSHSYQGNWQNSLRKRPQ